MASRGFSLIEALMAGVLFFLALTILTQVLVPTWQVAGRSYQQMDMAQLAALTLRHLNDDLQQAMYAGLDLPGAPVADVLAIHPLAGLGTDGRQIFANQLIIYFRTSTGDLYRRTWPPQDVTLSCGTSLPTDRPVTLTPADLTSLKAPSSGSRLITRYLQTFKLTASIYGQPLNLVLTLQCPVPGRPQDTESYTLQQDLYLRNDTL